MRSGSAELVAPCLSPSVLFLSSLFLLDCGQKFCRMGMETTTEKDGILKATRCFSLKCENFVSVTGADRIMGELSLRDM